MPLLYRRITPSRGLSPPIVFALIRRTFFLVATGVFGVAAYAAWYAFSTIEAAGYPAEFQIAPGSGLRSAARQIEAGGVAVGRIRFEILVRALGRSQDIKAGSYELDAAVTPLQLLDKLTQGDVTQAGLTLIEGWTFRQFRAAINANTSLKGDSKALSDAEILKRIGAAENYPEGLFFPDTYLFSKNSSDFDVLRRAYASMRRHMEQEWLGRDQKTPYRSPYEALIMASIVEKETGRAEERDMIAGTLVNRLRIGMRLQVDPTVIYGLGEEFDGNLRRRDLLEDGPYNTYLRGGLPPTPIAMPGLGAIRAALRPSHTLTLYYVSRGDGSSQFSRTLDEHNRAVAKYQLKR